jgi:hypothetical protein
VIDPVSPPSQPGTDVDPLPTRYPPAEPTSEQGDADDREPGVADLPARVTEIVRPPLADDEAQQPDPGES